MKGRTKLLNSVELVVDFGLSSLSKQVPIQNDFLTYFLICLPIFIFLVELFMTNFAPTTDKAWHKEFMCLLSPDRPYPKRFTGHCEDFFLFPVLTHISLASYFWDISKQYRPRSGPQNAASHLGLHCLITGISIKKLNKNEKYS